MTGVAKPDHLFLVPKSGPDHEPRDAALATWRIHEPPVSLGEWRISCVWVDDEGRQYGWWAPAEKGRPWS